MVRPWALGLGMIESNDMSLSLSCCSLRCFDCCLLNLSLQHACLTHAALGGQAWAFGVQDSFLKGDFAVLLGQASRFKGFL